VLKDIRTFKKRYDKAIKKYRHISEEELIDLDQTMLEIFIPRLKDFYEVVSTMSNDVTWLNKINSLISLGSSILNNKKGNKDTDILNNDLVIAKDNIILNKVEEKHFIDVLEIAKAENLTRMEFKKILNEILFTLKL